MPWASIIELILSGDIALERIAPIKKDWRTCVAPVDPDAFHELIVSHGVKRVGAPDEWLTRNQASHILKIEETGAWALAKAGLMPKRKGVHAMFRRADVEAAARKYVFVAEMIDRTVFNIGHELGRWLKSVGVLPVQTLHEGRYPIYDRAEFERVLPLQPAQDTAPPERTARRISSKVKRDAVAAVKSGLAPHHVAKRIGADHTAVARWVAYADKHGDVQPAIKLEPFEADIRAIIDADPSISMHALWHVIKETKVKVGYGSVVRFVNTLGYSKNRKMERFAKRYS